MSGKHQRELKDEVWVRQKYEAEQKTIYEIAEMLGCFASTVARALKRFGIKPRGRVEDGITEKACEHCGMIFPVGGKGQRKRNSRFCSRPCMYQVVKPPRGHGSNAPRPKKNRDTLHNEEWLRGQYLNEKRSIVEIAVELDCSVNAVCHALKKFGIPARTPAEAKLGRKIKSRADADPNSSVGRARRRAFEQRQALKAEMVAAYGGCCACCGERAIEFLTVDHVNRNGNEHRKQIGGQSYLYKLLKELGWPKDEYRCLCMNCNFAMRLGRTCPHQLKKEGGTP